MIKIIVSSLCLSLLLFVPAVAFGYVYIPEDEYVGFYDSDGIYTIIAGVKNKEYFPVDSTLEISVNDDGSVFTEKYDLTTIMPDKMMPFKVKLPQIQSSNPILEPAIITYHKADDKFTGGYVIYETLEIHSDGSLTGQIRNGGQKTFENFRIYALIKDDEHNVLDTTSSQKFDLMKPGDVLEFHLMAHPAIANYVDAYSCFAFGDESIFPLNTERFGEQYTLRYESLAWFTRGVFNEPGTELSLYGYNSWQLDGIASFEFPQSSVDEDFEVFLGDESVKSLQSIDEMGNWHLYFTIPQYYQGDVKITGFKAPDGTVEIPDELDLSTMILYEIEGGQVTGITGMPKDKSLQFLLDTVDDGEITITLSDFLIRPFDDGTFFVMIDDEQFDDFIYENKQLIIPFDFSTQKIEIFGGYVVPEFGSIVMIILVVSVISTIIITKRNALLNV